MERVMEAATALLSARHALPAGGDAVPTGATKRPRKHGHGKRKAKQPLPRDSGYEQPPYGSTLPSRAGYAAGVDDFASDRSAGDQRYAAQNETSQTFPPSHLQQHQQQTWPQQSYHSLRRQDINQILAHAEPTPEFAKPMYTSHQYQHHPHGTSQVHDRRSATAVIHPGHSIVPEVYRRQRNIIDVDPRLRGFSTMSHGFTPIESANGYRLVPPFRPLSAISSTSSSSSAKSPRFPNPSFPSADLQLGSQRFAWSQPRSLPQTSLSQFKTSYHEGHSQPQKSWHPEEDARFVGNTQPGLGANVSGTGQLTDWSRHSQNQSHGIEEADVHSRSVHFEHVKSIDSFDRDRDTTLHVPISADANHFTQREARPISNHIDSIHPEFPSKRQFGNSMWSAAEDMSQAARTITPAFQSATNVSSLPKPMFMSHSDPLVRAFGTPLEPVSGSQPTGFHSDIGRMTADKLPIPTTGNSIVVVAKPISGNRLRKIAKQTWRQERKEKMRAEKERSASTDSRLADLDSDSRRAVIEQILSQQPKSHASKKRNSNKAKVNRKTDVSKSAGHQEGVDRSAGETRPSGSSLGSKELRLARGLELEQEQLVRGAHLAMLANQQLQQRNPLESNALPRPTPTIVARSASSVVNGNKRARLGLNPPGILHSINHTPINPRLLPKVVSRSVDDNGRAKKPTRMDNPKSEALCPRSSGQDQGEGPIFPTSSSVKPSAAVFSSPRSGDTIEDNANENGCPGSQRARDGETRAQKKTPQRSPDRGSHKWTQPEVSHPDMSSESSSIDNAADCKTRDADHPQSSGVALSLQSGIEMEFAPVVHPNRTDAVGQRLEPETVMIFCKRDFLRFQAGRLWRKFQEIKRKRDISSAAVTGRRTRYMKARYRTTEQSGDQTTINEGCEEVDNLGKDDRDAIPGDDERDQTKEMSNGEARTRNEEALETKSAAQEECAVVNRPNHDKVGCDVSTNHQERDNDRQSSPHSTAITSTVQNSSEPAFLDDTGAPVDAVTISEITTQDSRRAESAGPLMDSATFKNTIQMTCTPSGLRGHTNPEKNEGDVSLTHAESPSLSLRTNDYEDESQTMPNDLDKSTTKTSFTDKESEVGNFEDNDSDVCDLRGKTETRSGGDLSPPLSSHSALDNDNNDSIIPISDSLNCLSDHAIATDKSTAIEEPQGLRRRSRDDFHSKCDDEEPMFVTIEEDTFGEWKDTDLLQHDAKSCTPTNGLVKPASSDDLSKPSDSICSSLPAASAIAPQTRDQGSGDVVVIPEGDSFGDEKLPVRRILEHPMSTDQSDLTPMTSSANEGVAHVGPGQDSPAVLREEVVI